MITETKAGLWTDGRYFVHAEKQLSGTCVTFYRMGNDMGRLAAYVEGTTVDFGGMLCGEIGI